MINVISLENSKLPYYLEFGQVRGTFLSVVESVSVLDAARRGLCDRLGLWFELNLEYIATAELEERARFTNTTMRFREWQVLYSCISVYDRMS